MQKPLEREQFFYCRIVSSTRFARSRLLGHSFFQPNRFGDQAIDEQGLVDLSSPSKDNGGSTFWEKKAEGVRWTQVLVTI
jgi:hypothetical protein